MQDIVDLLVANNKISKEEAELFVTQFFSLIEKGLSIDELVKVKDFGSFKLTHIQARESVDVNTQEKIVISAHRRVSFVPAPSLKDMVNKPFAHFETTPLNDGIFMDGVSQGALSDIDREEMDGDDDQDEIENKDVSKDGAPICFESVVTDINELTLEEEHSETQNDELSVPVFAFPPAEENSIDEATSIELTPVESVSIDEEKEMMNLNQHEHKEEREKSEENTAIRISRKSSDKKPKTKGKLRRYILRWDIAIALFIIFTIAFAFNYYFAKHNPCEKGIEESEIPKPIKQVVTAPDETPSNVPAIVADSVLTTKTSEPVKIVKMSPGRTLRLIALDKLGNREFWVYIYMKNKDEILNPDVIPIGVELELPNRNEYPMDANNLDDVAKAKTLGDAVIKGF